jgi:LAS seventeen-binding protein 5
VKKKVLAILASWSRQFKDDRSAAGIASLYRQVKSATHRKTDANTEVVTEREREAERKQKEKEEAKRKAKEGRRRLEEEARQKKHFDFERVRFCIALIRSYVLIPTVHRRNHRCSLLSQTRLLPQIT